MCIGTTQLFRRYHFSGSGPDKRRAGQEDGSGPIDDDGLIAHSRDVSTAGRANAHHYGDLGYPCRIDTVGFDDGGRR